MAYRNQAVNITHNTLKLRRVRCWRFMHVHHALDDQGKRDVKAMLVTATGACRAPLWAHRPRSSCVDSPV